MQVGLISTFRLIGGAVATAIYTSIQSSRFKEILPGGVTTAAEASGFNGSVPALITAAGTNTPAAYAKVPGITNSTIAAVQFAVKQANAESYRLVYYVAIAFGAIAIASAFSTKAVDEMSRSNQTAARLENEKEGGKIVDYHTH